MNSFPDFHKYDGLGLAELVRTKKISPAELVEESITRIEVHNPRINAVIYKMYIKLVKSHKANYLKAHFRVFPSY
jgi:amidase